MFIVYVQGVPKKFPTDSRQKKCTQKPGINVYFKDFWYKKVNLSQKYNNCFLPYYIYVQSTKILLLPSKCEIIFVTL